MRRLPVPRVFKPLSDSVVLAEQTVHERTGKGGRVLDLCTGSGIIAITAARHGASAVTAVDISRLAVVAAHVNARLNGTRIRTLRGDLFAPVRDERFDLIVANPPYVPSATDDLPARGPNRALNAGTSGRAFIDRICVEAPRHLYPGGAILLIHSSVCSEQATLSALRSGGLVAGTVFRKRGPLGRVLSARSSMLRARGLLAADNSEEILIMRGELPAASDTSPDLSNRQDQSNRTAQGPVASSA